VQSTEKGADAEDAGPGAVAPHQVLEHKAAEEDFFACRTAEKQGRCEEGGRHGNVGVIDVFIVGEAEDDGGRYEQDGSRYTEGEAGQQVSAGAGNPGETEIA
jgi:hypothetical protein